MLNKDTYLYELSYSWYEEYSPNLFVSTISYSETEWQSLCDSLLESAVDREMQRENKNWIGWRNIVDSMCLLLKEKGFISVKPIQADYFGASIIDSEREVRNLPPKSAEKIIAYNKAFKEELMKVIFLAK